LVADIPNGEFLATYRTYLPGSFTDSFTGGISNFFSQLIVSFGYTPEQSLLYGTPGGAVEVVSLIVCGYLGSYYRNRILISMSGLNIVILGMLLIVRLPLSNSPGRLAGYYLTQASPTPFIALLSLIANNVAGYTKKTTFAALYLISYCFGNIIGPQVFQTRDKPQYRPAEITMQRSPLLSAGLHALSICCSYGGIASGRRRRRRRLGRCRSIRSWRGRSSWT
jgi:hypothetical protein